MNEGGNEADALARENEALRRQMTAAEAAQKALRESEERYRSLFQNMLNGYAYCRVVFQQDRAVDFTYLMVNERFEALTGLRDVVGKNATVVMPGVRGSDPELFEIYGRVASTGVPERFERRVVALDRWFSVSVYSPKKEHFVAVFDVITERKRAEEALKASEARFRTLLDQSSDGILVADLATKGFRYANPRICRMLGYSESELCRMRVPDIHPTDSLPRVLEEFEKEARGEKTLAVDMPCLRKDGTIAYADISTALVTIDGRASIAGFFRDATERRQSQHELEASETRYRRLFEAAKDGILILDADTGKIVDVNPFLEALTGYTRSEFLGKHLWQIGPFKDITASRVSFAELQAKEYVRYEDLPLEARDGRKIDVEFVSNVYRVDGQSVIQCNIRDITARKRAEADHQRLATAIEQAAEVVVVTDRDGSIVYVNPAFEAVTGYSRAEVLGHNPRLLKSGAQSEGFYRALWETISSGKNWHGRIVNKKKDGTLYTEDATISPVRDPAGAITSYVAVKRDITPDLALEAQFLQAQKMEGIGRLAGGIAHDFNNLLSVILSCTAFVAEGLREGDPLLDDLLEVTKAGERAAGLTRQLLAFSRKQVLQPEPLDLNRIAAGIEKMLDRILGEDIELHLTLAADLGRTMADPGQIEQVIMNLAVNARDAMPEGGLLTIETSNVELDAEYAASHMAVKPGPYVMLAVTDTGCGIDEQTKGRIFEPFFTTKEPGKGTGLGLSTVYGIVKQTGGTVWVYSEPGRGTTFKVYLPRDLSAGLAPVTKPPAVPRRAKGNETILVVEDEEALRMVARRTLEAAGYKVLTAADGEEALVASDRHPGEIHLLLTDVVMPRMGGRALAAKLSKTRPGLEVLYMSGYTGDAIVHHGVLEVGTHFLAKPFSSADLTRRVREVLDG
jgi:PAS domain S-box-containing protein